MSNCNHDCSNCSNSSCESRTIQKATVLENTKIKKIIAVTSGKGGVGKSMVSALLASNLQKKGYQVGIIDADITGPSMPKMFGLNDKIYGDGIGMFPSVSISGIKIMSVNLLLENEDDPILWRGALITSMLMQFYSNVYWDELDYLIIDMPPGTGDIALSIYQSIPVDEIVIVTSPQDLVSLIVSKSIKMAKTMNIKIAGLVENMSYMKCPCCNEKIDVFNHSHVNEVSSKYELDVLAHLPIDPELAKLADTGMIEDNNVDYLDDLVNKVM